MHLFSLNVVKALYNKNAKDTLDINGKSLAKLFLFLHFVAYVVGAVD